MSGPYYQDENVTVHSGDCLDVLRELDDNGVDAVVTDPPYGLEFMGKEWDRPWAVTATACVGFEGREDNLTLPSHRDGRNANCRACGGRQRGAKRCTCQHPQWDRAPASDMREFGAWCEQWAAECLRVLKPGGHMAAFGGTRTWHRLAVAIEDAGFEIRDNLAWIYGSGFPKSLDVSKAIDKAAGAEREVIGTKLYADGASRVEAWPGGENGNEGWLRPGRPSGDDRELRPVTAPSTDAAKPWQGWGTALKPAFEPIILARKPFRGTVASNVVEHGTGALNIDACRVAVSDDDQKAMQRANSPGSGRFRAHRAEPGAMGRSKPGDVYDPSAGRWPANVLLDPDTAAELDKQSGVLHSGANPTRRGSDKFRNAYGDFIGQEECVTHRGADSGGASRFFPIFRYTAKAPGTERPTVDGISHPTVKPLELMRWLVRLVTPSGGIVLDPFAGTGTTAEAAIHEHKQAIVIEREESYLPLIVARLSKPMAVGFDFDGEAS